MDYVYLPSLTPRSSYVRDDESMNGRGSRKALTGQYGVRARRGGSADCLRRRRRLLRWLDLAAAPLPRRRKGGGARPLVAASPQGRAAGAAREARGGREHERNLTVGFGVEWQGFAVARACNLLARSCRLPASAAFINHY